MWFTPRMTDMPGIWEHPSILCWIRTGNFAEIAVYVLTLGLSEENQERLREIAEYFGRRLFFLNLDDLAGAHRL